MSKTHIWVGVWPTEESAIALGDTVPGETQLHLTLGFFELNTTNAHVHGGPLFQDGSVLWNALKWLATYLPAEGAVTGRATFFNRKTAQGGESLPDHQTLLVESEYLAEAHRALQAVVGQWLSPMPWIPHITVPHDREIPRFQAIEFDRAYLTWGGARYPIVGLLR